MNVSSARRLAAALSVALALGIAGCSSSGSGTFYNPPSAGGGGTGSAQVRAVHASPNAGNVDLYVYAKGATRPTTATLANVAYKAISNYLSIPAGSYTVDVEAAGSPSTTTPVASENVNVDANTNYSVVVAGEAGSSLQFVNFTDPAETSGQSALVVYHASPFVGSAIQPVGVAVYDAGAVSGTPTAAQTTQLFSFAFTPGASGPAASGTANGGEFFISPVPSTLPATLGLAAGAPGTSSLSSVALAAPLSAIIPGATGFPANGHVSIFAVDASASSATLIGTVDH